MRNLSQINVKIWISREYVYFDQHDDVSSFQNVKTESWVLDLTKESEVLASAPATYRVMILSVHQCCSRDLSETFPRPQYLLKFWNCQVHKNSNYRGYRF